jgi:OOP family OmpA-OmpF porin
MRVVPSLALALTVGAALAVLAAPGDQPVQPLPPTAAASAAAAQTKANERTASLPASGLFQGEELSERGRSQLTELILDALGLHVEVALVMPTGPWRLDGDGSRERDLTPARLNAVKRFLSERGIDPQRIYVESRIDQTLTEPRLDLQLLGREAAD